jgi:outer membrane protein
MKTRICFIAVVMYVLQNGLALAQGLSLQEALQKAQENRLDIKIKQYDTQVSENEVQKINTKNLPQVSADFDFRYNTLLQTSIVPAATTGGTGADRAVQFGTNYNTQLGLNLTQNIFNPTTKGDRQIAAAQREYNALAESTTTLMVKQEVTEAYFAALLYKEKSKLSADNVNRTLAIFNTTKSQYQEGTASQYDMERSRIEHENARAEHQKNTNNQTLAIADLYYKMGADAVTTDSLSDNITSLYTAYRWDEKSSDELKRPELSMERAQFTIYEQSRKKQNLTYLPTVSLYANYSMQYLNNDLTPFQSEQVYPFSYLGLKASLPLFDGFYKEKYKAEYKMRSQASKLRYDKLVKDYNQEKKQAETSIKNAQDDLDFQSKNLTLITSLYKIDSDRLKNGAIKPNDLSTTYYTLQQTQTNYLNALYSYLIAVVAYKKAEGTL